MPKKNRDRLERIQPLRLAGFKDAPELYRGLSVHVAEDTPVQVQFDAFRTRVLRAIGSEFLPVYRMADGEFALMVGWRTVQREGRSWARRAWHASRQLLSRMGVAGTKTGWGERYSRRRLAEARRRLADSLHVIEEQGIIGAYFVRREDRWGEEYLKPVMDWLDDNGIELTSRNYVPFYFVYALLRGPGRHELFRDRRVLVATSLQDGRRERIVEGLVREGVREVRFLEISASESMFDAVDPTPHIGHCDLALVAGGIGWPMSWPDWRHSAYRSSMVESWSNA